MSETAALNVRVEHSTAESAADSLTRLSKSGHEATDSAKLLQDATHRLNAELDRMVVAAEASAKAQAQSAAAASASARAQAQVQERAGLAALVKGQQAKAAATLAARASEQASNREALRAEFNDVRKTLLSEEAAIRESYARRRAIVRANVADPTEQRRLMRGLDRAQGRELAEASPGAARQLAGVARVAVPLVAGAAVVGGLAKTAEVTREFGKLSAGLITATGSARGAEQAFGALQDMAATTPYQLREITGSFVSLVNYGLNPGERALTSYGNTSAAMGKELSQMVEAVADATNGEFERLKEFGIKASAQGDKVTFMFRGVKTTVGRDSKSIQEYLMRLGEINFADAMSNRMKTLDGRISNLGDAWDRLFYTIGKGSIGDLMGDSVDTATAALGGLVDFLQSSALSNAITNLKGGFAEIAGIAHKGAGFISWLTTGNTEMSKNADATIKAERERLVVEQMAAEQAAKEAEENRKLAKEVKQAEKNFEALGEQRKKGLIDEDAYKAAQHSIVLLRSTTDEAVTTQIQAAAAAEKSAAVHEQAQASIAALVAKGASPKAAAAEVKRQVAEADAELAMVRAQYDRLINTSQSDRLGGYEKGGKSKKGPSKAQESQAKKDQAEFKQLQKKLQDEETEIESSFQRRQDLIDRLADKKTGEWASMSAVNVDTRFEELQKTANARAQQERAKDLEELRKSTRTRGEILRDSYKEDTAKVSGSDMAEDEKKELTRRILAKYDAEVSAQDEAESQKLQNIRDSFATEMELFARQQEEKRKAILESELLTGTERSQLLVQLEKQTSDRMAEEEMQRNDSILRSSSDLFQGLADTSRNLGGQQSSTYRALFAASKAFSIAQASMAIATGTAKALELGWPAGIAAGFQVAAQGAQLLAQVTNTYYAGTYDAGGSVGSGKFAIAGEKGPEIIWGPATVTSRKATEQIASQSSARSQQPQGGSPVRIIVAPDESAAAKYRATTQSERAYVVTARKYATEMHAIIGG